MRKNYPYLTVKGKKDRVHRHLMEERIGRPLEPNERVYHIDGNHLNNERFNLILIKFKDSSE